VQEHAEKTLTEEELRRNGCRRDLLYVSNAHPIAPDIFEIADLAAAVEDQQERSKVERAIDARLSGDRSHRSHTSSPSEWLAQRLMCPTTPPVSVLCFM
jgi:5'-3' exonuclease